MHKAALFAVGGLIVVLGIIAIVSSKPTEPAPALPLTTDSPMDTPSETNQAAMPSPTEKATQVTFVTTKGNIVLTLDTVHTPKTAENFLKLAKSGFYDGTRFHRVIAGFMIQGGDPLSKEVAKKAMWGTGGPGYTFPDELGPTNKNSRGTISMANRGPDTNGSQFFINLVDNDYLDTKHTVFGYVSQGLDVMDAVGKVPTDAGDKPIEDVIVTQVLVQ